MPVFREGERVFLFKLAEVTGERRKLARPFHGPYRLVEVGPNTAKIRRVDRPEEEPILVSLDRLRKCPAEIGEEFWPPGRKQRPKKGSGATLLSGPEPGVAAGDNQEEPILDITEPTGNPYDQGPCIAPVGSDLVTPDEWGVSVEPSCEQRQVTMPSPEGTVATGQSTGVRLDSDAIGAGDGMLAVGGGGVPDANAGLKSDRDPVGAANATPLELSPDGEHTLVQRPDSGQTDTPRAVHTSASTSTGLAVCGDIRRPQSRTTDPQQGEM